MEEGWGEPRREVTDYRHCQGVMFGWFNLEQWHWDVKERMSSWNISKRVSNGIVFKMEHEGQGGFLGFHLKNLG